MSETPVERLTVIDKHRGEQICSADADSRGPGSRSLEAGSEFLKALAADLGAVASRLRLLLAAKHRRPQQPPGHISSGSGIGRVLWRVSRVLLGVLLVCSGALSATMLWVIFGSPLEPRRSNPDMPGLRIETTNDASLSRKGTVNAAEPSRPDVRPVAEAPIQPGSSSAGAAEQEKPAEETTETKPVPTPAATPATQPLRTSVEAGTTTPTQDTATPIQGTTTVIKAVSLRSGPNTSWPVIGTLQPGMAVQVLASANYGWMQVETPAGSGWTYGSYLAPTGSTVVVEHPVPPQEIIAR